MKRIVSLLFIISFIFISCGSKQSYTNIKVSELDNFIEENPSYQYIDVRTSSEYKQGHIKGFENQDSQEILAGNYDIKKGEPVVVICRSGSRSGEVAKYLANNDYEVYNVENGISSYTGDLE